MKYTLASGKQLCLLFPFDNSIVKASSCSAKCSESEDNNSWIANIAPQLANAKFYGKTIKIAHLNPGDSIFIPGDWSMMFYTIEDSVALAQYYLTKWSIEDLVSSVLTQTQINHVKKVMGQKDELRTEYRRFVQVLKQIQKAKTKPKKK